MPSNTHLDLTLYVGISRIGVRPHDISRTCSIRPEKISFALKENPNYHTTFSRDVGIQTWHIVLCRVTVFFMKCCIRIPIDMDLYRGTIPDERSCMMERGANRTSFAPSFS